DSFQFFAPGVDQIAQEGRTVTLSFDPIKISAAALIHQITADYEIADLLVENPPIEEIVAELYVKVGGA
ncbi:MAG: ABC transporter, partial [Leptolyngbyaceae cyanobacterium SM1_3_5]|nr:ABC transporter [Leptolyngbyaceae cyanobacterium SM1_3_5]